jgi:hypothetical protein
MMASLRFIAKRRSMQRPDLDTSRFAAAEAKAVVAQADLHWIAERGEPNNFELFSFKQAHLEQALDDGIGALKGGDTGALPNAQLVQRSHRVGASNSGRGGISLAKDGHGANQDLCGRVGADAEPAAAHLQQARTTRLEHLESTSRAHPEFRHPADQGRISRDFGHVRPFSGAEQFQR